MTGDEVGLHDAIAVEKNQILALRLRNDNDLEAARKLVMSHLRFVLHIARGYAGYGLPLGDLVQEGNVGLMKAVKRFDPTQGVRLVSFAVHWIRAEIHDYVLRNWRLVKVATTKAQRKLFFNLRKSKKRLAWLSKDETEAVAADLGVTPREVTEMEQRLSGQDVSFDPDPEDEESFAPAAYLPSPNSDPASTVERADSDEDAHDRLNHRRARPERQRHAVGTGSVSGNQHEGLRRLPEEDAGQQQQQ